MIASDKTHFCGVVIRYYTEHLAAIQNAISHIDEVEISLVEDIKIIAVIEVPSEHRMTEIIHELTELKGVLSVSVAYHQVEDTHVLGEVVPSEINE